jgi:hypothetical protein
MATKIGNGNLFYYFFLFNQLIYDFSSKDIWSEVSHLKNIPVAANRTARQAGYDSGVSGGGASAGGSCSDCCSGGQAGPPGRKLKL